MSQHIYAHEHPESETDRGGGFTLWFTGLSGSGKTTIAHHVGPEMDRRGLVVEYLDGDTVRTHLSKGLGFSKEDRDAHVERLGWVASRDHATRRRRHRRGDLALRAGTGERSRAGRGARPVHRDPRPHVARRVRAPRRERALCEGVRRRDQGLHRGRRSRTRRRPSAEIVVDTEGLEPEESAAQVIAALEQLGLVPAKVTA